MQHYAWRSARTALREPCADDELIIEDTGTTSALRLLDRLFEGSGAAARLATADRDHLLAGLYIMVYGPKVESTVTCHACQTPFDLDFSLPDLLKHLQSAGDPSAAQALADGCYQIAPGIRFRLPTGEDELAAGIERLPGQSVSAFLLGRCLLEGNLETDGRRVETAMSALAPLLQTDVEARCPECGEVQLLRFDVQTFLLRRLLGERSRTLREIHRLAFAYRWNYREIMELPRSMRRAFVEMVEAETG